MARQIPLVAVNHLQAHVYACRLAAGRDVFPCVGLIVSGGHSSLYRCRGPLDFEFLGGTIDDAAGEAFDKVAAMLGLPYPGGPSIERAADGGQPAGLRLSPRVPPRRRPAGFQLQRTEDGRALCDRRARPARSGRRPLEHRNKWPTWPPVFRRRWSTAWWARPSPPCGRPACESCASAAAWPPTRRLRQRLQEEAGRQQIELHIAPLRLCTDNAVMGAIAVERWKAGLVETLDLDVFPGVVRHTG